MPHTRTTLTAIGINPPETVTGTFTYRAPMSGERYIGFGGLITALTNHRHAAYVLDETHHDDQPKIDTHRCDLGNGHHIMNDGTIG